MSNRIRFVAPCVEIAINTIRAYGEALTQWRVRPLPCGGCEFDLLLPNVEFATFHDYIAQVAEFLAAHKRELERAIKASGLDNVVLNVVMPYLPEPPVLFASMPRELIQQLRDLRLGYELTVASSESSPHRSRGSPPYKEEIVIVRPGNWWGNLPTPPHASTLPLADGQGDIHR